jgi:hypothetical protein
MNGIKLQDHLYSASGRTARFIGRSADAFRPQNAFTPLEPQNRFLRLPATFLAAKGRESQIVSYGVAIWQGIFDGSYTRIGDYLVLETATFFIASQEPLLPILCVRTNRVISIRRPNMQTHVAANPYGGYTSSASVILMTGWPASVLGENTLGSSQAGLPTDQSPPYWTVLMPASFGVLLSPGDIITDDLGRTAVIAASELSDLGWRISAKMACT